MMAIRMKIIYVLLNFIYPIQKKLIIKEDLIGLILIKFKKYFKNLFIPNSKQKL